MDPTVKKTNTKSTGEHFIREIDRQGYRGFPETKKRNVSRNLLTPWILVCKGKDLVGNTGSLVCKFHDLLMTAGRGLAPDWLKISPNTLGSSFRQKPRGIF